ncbi:DUF3923 family protein [uncultured Lactobacillus sp.]|uniref:DUF3923 family protein n=1 Tax=uncultured Lactobacillus sp. TaxID=153152 RepID=UPI002628C8B9|nr:DUF3923 family protein [uncultured Lactobacillus sp.]
MKLWWSANLYWLILLTWGSFKLGNYNFDTSELGEDLSRALIAVVVIAAALMIAEFQWAWYYWLTNHNKKG